MCVYNLRRQVNPQGSLASEPNLIRGTWPVENTVSNDKETKVPEEGQLELSSRFHMHINTHVHEHMCT